MTAFHPLRVDIPTHIHDMLLEIKKLGITKKDVVIAGIKKEYKHIMEGEK